MYKWLFHEYMPMFCVKVKIYMNEVVMLFHSPNEKSIGHMAIPSNI